MQKIITQFPAIKLAGITCKTNNAKIFESDPTSNKIASTVQNYFHNGLFNKIQHRKNPGVTYCVYTDYESDFNGDYTYFIGEEVFSFENMPIEFKTLSLPSQHYAKFTNESGPMPNVCIDMWKKIWAMPPQELGVRSYIADFEVYDERSRDHQNVVLDIYIGIKT